MCIRVMSCIGLVGIVVNAGCCGNMGLVEGCSPVVLPGVWVDLTNSQTGGAISGATLTLVEDGYTETMQESGAGVYLGSFGRTGTYSVTVQASGFANKTVDGIHSISDACGVATSTYAVTLDPI